MYLAVSNRISSITDTLIIHSRFLEDCSYEVDISPSSPHILEFFTFISINRDHIEVSNLLDKFIFGSKPVFKTFFFRLWSPVRVSRDGINRQVIFYLHTFCETCHRISLFMSWLVISYESDLDKSIVVFTPLVCSCDTFCITSICDFSIWLYHIVVSNMLASVFFRMSVFDRLECSFFVSCCIVELYSFYFFYFSPFTL